MSGMESEASDSGVVRRESLSVRSHPYAKGSGSAKENMREEVIQLGVELSVYVAEFTFLLCDDNPALLLFCFKLWGYVVPYPNRVLVRLFLVIHRVHSKHIKPKSGDSQWDVIKTTWNDFVRGISVLHRLVLLLRRRRSCDEQLFLTRIANYKQQILRNLEEKLRHVSEENGFVRETIEPYILELWKSIFCGDASQLTTDRTINDLFKPLLAKSPDSEIRALPIIYYPHNIPRTEELKKEAVRLGVELSLYVAQAMFLLSDDVRTMLWFCVKLWRDDVNRNLTCNSTVVGRLLGVIHNVYLMYIKPKNGVYRNDGISVQLRLAKTTRPNFEFGFAYLELLVLNLRGEGNSFDGLAFTSGIKQELKRLEEKLRPAKAVLDANGFKREAIECCIYGVWKSLCDEKVAEATRTLKLIYDGIISDVFLPLENEVGPYFIEE